MEHNTSDYNKEIYFNMGMEFYNLLANIKKIIITFYAEGNYEKVIDFLHEEYMHIKPFVKTVKIEEKENSFLKIEKNLKKIEIYQMHYRIFRRLYLEIKKELNQLEAENGMLQPFSLKLDNSVPFAVRK